MRRSRSNLESELQSWASFGQRHKPVLTSNNAVQVLGKSKKSIIRPARRGGQEEKFNLTAAGFSDYGLKKIKKILVKRWRVQKTGLIQKYNNAIGKVIEISALYTTHAPKF